MRSLPPFAGRVVVAAQRWRGFVLGVVGTAGVILSLAALVRPGLLPPSLLPIDGLSATFLLPLSVSVLADRSERAGLAMLAALVAVTARDAFTLVLGVELAALLSRRNAAGAVPMLAAVALLGSMPSFASLHAHPPEGWRAGAVLLLALAGALPRLRAPALVLPVAALYLLARLLLDLSGPVTPAWWGAPLVIAGAALAALEAWRANHALALPAFAAHLFNAGLSIALAALGVSLVARGSDLPGLAASAASAMAVLMLAHAAAAAVFLAGAGAVGRGAGSLALPLLGGLARTMPATAACLAAASCSLAFLPPLSGFAGLWLTVQVLLATARTGVTYTMVLVPAAALLGLAVTLSLAACVRLLAVACLGRPRVPRAAAAEDPAATPRALMLAGTALLLLPGFAPVLFSPAILEYVGAEPSAGTGAMPVLLVVLVALTGLILLVQRRRPARTITPWEDGRDPPPPWLPFGDPALQWSAASFAAPLRVSMAAKRPPPLAAWPARYAAGFAIVLFLILLGTAIIVPAP